MPVRIAARSYGAVDTILTGIGTFSERFWERILSADPANIDVVLELLVQRLDTPSSYAALRRSARRLSPAATFLPPIRRTSAVRRVSCPCLRRTSSLPCLPRARTAYTCCTVRARRL